MISATSVKGRLKNQAVASGKTFQEALTVYGLERTVYRLSVSEYVEQFTLKGGIFLYALFEGEFARATRDIDLLARNMPNNIEDKYVNLFRKELEKVGIQEYVKNQMKEDLEYGQMSLKEHVDPYTGEPVVKA